jgi:hypothetical protein
MREPLPRDRESHVRQHVRMRHEEVLLQNLLPTVAWNVHVLLIVRLLTQGAPQCVPVLAVQLGEVREGVPSARSRGRRARRPGAGHIPSTKPRRLGPHVHDRSVEQSTRGYLPRDVPE